MAIKIRSGLIPLLIFVLIFSIFLFGLRKNPQELPSVLINQSLPKFSLVDLNNQLIDNNVLKNKVVIINIWASWCYACVKEHQALFSLAKIANIMLIGVNYKDSANNAIQWLANLGDPYKLVIFDPEGSLSLDLGVYGVPETFIIDKNSLIRMRISGPLTSDIITHTIMPLLEKIK